MGPVRSSSRTPNRNSASTPYAKSTTYVTKSTGPYNPNFLQNLIDHSIYPPGYRHPSGAEPTKPTNLEDVTQRLSCRRPSLSPSKFSEEEFQQFAQADYDAHKEQQVKTYVIPVIEGDVEDAKCRAGEIPFRNLDHLTDASIVPGHPDTYYGARPEQLDKRVRTDLSGQIVPCNEDSLPLAPNFFLAVKGPHGTPVVAERQALYDGTLGARGMYSLQSYQQEESAVENKAVAITSIYQRGLLRIFTVHRAQSPEGRPKYFMHQVKAWAMMSDSEAFRQGAMAYRNARDWAKEQRDEAIRQANERVNRTQAEGTFGPNGEPPPAGESMVSYDS